MVHMDPLSTQPYICLPWTRIGAYHNDAARHPTVIDLGISRGLMAGNGAVCETWGLVTTAVTRLKEFESVLEILHLCEPHVFLPV